MIPITTKTCASCHQSKPRGEFYAASTARDGLRNDCKGCVQDWAANRRPRRGQAPPPWEHAAAHAALLDALAAATAVGQAIPCHDPEAGDLWISDDRDDVALAADCCRSCPVLARCRAYAFAARERGGTWGGLHAEGAQHTDHHRPHAVA